MIIEIQPCCVEPCSRVLSVQPLWLLYYKEDNELDLEKLKKLLENKVTEFEDLEEPKEEKKKILKAFHIRKKTLRRKNITPMKSRSRLFKNKSLKK